MRPATALTVSAAALALALSFVLGALWLRAHRGALPWGAVWMVAAAAAPVPAVVAAQALIIAGATALSEGSLVAICMSGLLACLGDWALARVRSDLSHHVDRGVAPARRAAI